MLNKRYPQMSLVALLPVHANYPCILRPSPFKPNPLNGNPSNPSSNNQHLTTKHPYPKKYIRLMPQGPPAEAPQQQLSHPTMQLPLNTMMVPKQHFTIALWFLNYIRETNMSYMCGQCKDIRSMMVDNV